MMRGLVKRPGLVFALVFAWKVALLVFTAQPVPANDSFFYDGPVVNLLLHGRYVNPALIQALPISGGEVFSAYPPLHQAALLGWMSVWTGTRGVIGRLVRVRLDMGGTLPPARPRRVAALPAHLAAPPSFPPARPL